MVFFHSTILDQITEAYYKDEMLLTPSDKTLAEIEEELDSMETRGQIVTATGVLGFAATPLVWNTPYIGKLMGVATSIYGISAIIIGREEIKVACNLEGFIKVKKSTQNASAAHPDTQKKDFKITLQNSALNGTLFNTLTAQWILQKIQPIIETSKEKS